MRLGDLPVLCCSALPLRGRVRRPVAGVGLWPTRHVLGMDLHPVAVTLARVTYLLAIGRERLTHPDRGPIQVPVYLGDAVQWRREADDLFSGGNLVIETDDQKQLFDAELRFPRKCSKIRGSSIRSSKRSTKLAGSRKPGLAVPKLSGFYQRYAVSPSAQKTLDATFRTLCNLHDDGRDHIWSYYVRNLARPWWLALPQNRVDLRRSEIRPGWPLGALPRRCRRPSANTARNGDSGTERKWPRIRICPGCSWPCGRARTRE